MTAVISPIHLFDIQRGEQVDAELWDAITERQLGDWEAEWLPALFHALQRLNRTRVERRLWPQSREWNWRRKAEALNGMLAYQGFSIMCAGMTEGMMIVDTTMKRCRIDNQRGRNLVYVEYVETAPWNQPSLFLPKYKGIGSLFMRVAIEFSQYQGFNGRIGLHSLPQANGFYGSACGMTDLGIDPNYGDLRYFEMTPDQADAFIAKGDQP